MKWICKVCGYVYEGPEAPEFCPQCKAPKSKFQLMGEEKSYADEHRVGVAEGVDPRIIEGLRMNFNGECTEVGMYLAMSRQADRDGYPEVAEAFKRYAWEEAEHAAKFAELLGEVVTSSTKKNLELRAEAEWGATAAKKELAVAPRSLTWMPSTTPSMRCARMRPAMARASTVCSSVISANNNQTRGGYHHEV